MTISQSATASGAEMCATSGAARAGGRTVAPPEAQLALVSARPRPPARRDTPRARISRRPLAAARRAPRCTRSSRADGHAHCAAAPPTRASDALVRRRAVRRPGVAPPRSVGVPNRSETAVASSARVAATTCARLRPQTSATGRRPPRRRHSERARRVRRPPTPRRDAAHDGVARRRRGGGGRAEAAHRLSRASTAAGDASVGEGAEAAASHGDGEASGGGSAVGRERDERGRRVVLEWERRRREGVVFEEECALATPRAASSAAVTARGGSYAASCMWSFSSAWRQPKAPSVVRGMPSSGRSPRRDRHTPCTVSPSTAAAAASSAAAAASSSSGAHAGTLTRRPP